MDNNGKLLLPLLVVLSRGRVKLNGDPDRIGEVRLGIGGKE